jgi:hypothetical protein
MNRITTNHSISPKSIILKKFEKMDYFDSFSLSLTTDKTIDEIITAAFRLPGWVLVLMKIRNAAVKPFGLETGSNWKGGEAAYYPAGSRAPVFTVIYRNKNEIVTAEDDKHLYFRFSAMIERKKPESVVTITTVVKFKNIWGRIYFLPVKPFHKFIMKALLKRLKT